MAAADADHGQGARRRHRSLRPDVQADQPRSGEEVSDRQSHLPGSADRQRRRPHVHRRARRRAGARRARVRRRRDRRHGDAVAIEEVPRGLLRQHGRQHAARSGGRHEGARGALSRGSTSIAPASTATRAAATPPPTPCSAIPISSRSGSREAGNHDNRVYEDDWAEKWQGLLETKPDGTTNYDNQANQLIAKNLKGKLLLAHGTMDANVPPNNTLLVVDALIKANKDFDLLMLPNRGHGFGNEAVHGAAAVGLFRAASARRRAAARVRAASARGAADADSGRRR